ncbi:hypothetical protein [Plantactinospora sonchi]|uniref:DUF2127 domain-containing protein n=1 Tax=Plantactinospora sonchi TaxID=1544735 RepID=A0ABU7S0J8_9ACTN
MPDIARRAPTRWTVPLQTLVVACSVVFVIGTTFQTFVIIDQQAIVDMMRGAGASAEQASADAPAFLLGFRLVGCAYIVGNALGLLARTGRGWVFWLILLVNVTQAAGVVVIPPEVFEVTRERFGVLGLLPSWITDGGAAVLSLILVISLIRYRTAWAHRRKPMTHVGAQRQP